MALRNALPPEPGRFARGPYLLSGLLIVIELLQDLGAFADDPAVDGHEDHDFWCRFTEEGSQAAPLPEVLVSRHSPMARPDGPVQVDPWSAWKALSRLSPGLHWA